jgi:mannose-6-phosphate isomerase-like protein (cupin superfamily)
MPVIKGKDVPTIRLWRCCGCWLKAYPIPEASDLSDFLASPDVPEPESEKWPYQPHSHPDFEEYWYICSGKGEVKIGDELFDVEEGDLVITPRGVPHQPGPHAEKFTPDFKFICFGCKHNVFGKTVAPKTQYRGEEEVYREDPTLGKVETIEVDMSSEYVSSGKSWEDYASKHGFKVR